MRNSSQGNRSAAKPQPKVRPRISQGRDLFLWNEFNPPEKCWSVLWRCLTKLVERFDPGSPFAVRRSGSGFGVWSSGCGCTATPLQSYSSSSSCSCSKDGPRGSEFGANRARPDRSPFAVWRSPLASSPLATGLTNRAPNAETGT